MPVVVHDQRFMERPAFGTVYRADLVQQPRTRARGLCVDGSAIARGDRVFRPRSSDVCLTANRERMILAATIQPRTGVAAPDTLEPHA